LNKTIPILIIFLVIFINFFILFNKDKEKKNFDSTVPPIAADKEMKENILDEGGQGNTEISGGTSDFHVENIDYILDYLDLDMMLRYRDLLSTYTINLSDLAIDRNREQFYKANKEIIFNIFGISSYEGFLNINNVLLMAGVTKDTVMNYAKLEDIEEVGNLLRIKMVCNFKDGSVALEHYVNYVFIENEPKVYIYEVES